ncbi:uncharacterized protein LOC118356505 [Zalophus californianus]|uniref:Uncharacterized protein LOC118356505 n=1 Tax=Zalophus californianus TaxID=9704 RepID=A0A6P9FIV0_ZALCA|nr:uncharacterized protein LOC118356505 [Zalophus californianus]
MEMFLELRKTFSQKILHDCISWLATASTCPSRRWSSDLRVCRLSPPPVKAESPGAWTRVTPGGAGNGFLPLPGPTVLLAQLRACEAWLLGHRLGAKSAGGAAALPTEPGNPCCSAQRPGPGAGWKCRVSGRPGPRRSRRAELPEVGWSIIIFQMRKQTGVSSGNWDLSHSLQETYHSHGKMVWVLCFIQIDVSGDIFDLFTLEHLTSF